MPDLPHSSTLYFYEAIEVEDSDFRSHARLQELVETKIHWGRVVHDKTDFSSPAVLRPGLQKLLQERHRGIQVFFSDLGQMGNSLADLERTLNVMRQLNMRAVCVEISRSLDIAGSDGTPILAAMAAYGKLQTKAHGRLVRKGQNHYRKIGHKIGRGIEIPNTTVRKIERLLDSGLKATDAANAVGVDRWTVYRVIARRNRTMPDDPHSEELD